MKFDNENDMICPQNGTGVMLVFKQGTYFGRIGYPDEQNRNVSIICEELHL